MAFKPGFPGYVVLREGALIRDITLSKILYRQELHSLNLVRYNHKKIRTAYSAAIGVPYFCRR